MIRRHSLTALAVLLAIAASAVDADAADDDFRRSITMSGTGETTAAPDMAHVSAGVQSEAPTAREALTANNRTMAAVVEGLKAAGIAEKDIQTSNFNVGPRYDHSRDGKPPVLVGYQVSNTVTVAVRDLAGLGELLDRVVALGANTINGIQFSIDEPTKLEDEARRLAIADARRKAELYAAAAGFRIGRVLSVTETGHGGPPPMPYMRGAARMEAADAVPIQHGEQTVSISVNVSWEIE